MAALKIMKAEVKYQCPGWEFCNEMLNSGLTTGTNTCRFCVKRRNQHYCCLHDEALHTHADGTVDKCKACLGSTKTLFKPKVQEIDATDKVPEVNPRAVIKSTADQMQKLIKQLLGQGYPAEMAVKAAHETITKGGW